MTEESSTDLCIDADAALSLSSALGPDPERTLRHAVGCEACVQRLREWTVVQRALRSDSVPSGFVDEVVQQAAQPPGMVHAWGWRVVNAGLGALAAGLVLVVLRASPSPLALLGASVAAAVAVLAAQTRLVAARL